MFPAWAQTDLGSLGDMRTALMSGRTGGISCPEGQGAEADTQKEKGKDPLIMFSYSICKIHIISSWVHRLPFE